MNGKIIRTGLAALAIGLAVGTAAPAAALATLDEDKFVKCLNDGQAEGESKNDQNIRCCVAAGGWPELNKYGYMTECAKHAPGESTPFTPVQPGPIVGGGGPGLTPDESTQPAPPVVVRPGGNRA